jgi:putative toxin-antitoxin system antitoxin component (TIGR02293 family)
MPSGLRDQVFRRAVEVLGSEDAAGKWMDEDAIGLPDRKPPSAFLGSPEDVEMVEAYLGRIEHGVYT